MKNSIMLHWKVIQAATTVTSWAPSSSCVLITGARNCCSCRDALLLESFCLPSGECKLLQQELPVMRVYIDMRNAWNTKHSFTASNNFNGPWKHVVCTYCWNGTMTKGSNDNVHILLKVGMYALTAPGQILVFNSYCAAEKTLRWSSSRRKLRN